MFCFSCGKSLPVGNYCFCPECLEVDDES